MTVTGTYVLPSPILVNESLLGKVNSFEFEGQSVKIFLPSLASDGSVAPPDVAAVESQCGDGADWIGDPPDPRADWLGSPPTPTSGPQVLQLRRVAVCLPSLSDPVGVGEYLDRWFEFVATWVEVRFAQDLNGNWPVSHLETPDSNFQPSSPRDASSRVVLYWDVSVPLDSSDWDMILHLSSSEQSPPLEEIVLCSAKSWERRRRSRLAIIDAGLAAEISVGKLLRKNLSPSFNLKGKKFYEMINLIYDNNIPTHVSKESLDSLRLARNKAVHEAIEISSQDLAHAIITADRLVRDIQ